MLKGIRDNALYIFTAPEFRPGIEDRFEAILRAIGRDEARERTSLELIPNWSAARSTATPERKKRAPERGGISGAS